MLAESQNLMVVCDSFQRHSLYSVIFAVITSMFAPSLVCSYTCQNVPQIEFLTVHLLFLFVKVSFVKVVYVVFKE